MTKSYSQRRLETIAYHEAGHVVVSCLMDVPFIQVTVIPDGRVGGCVVLSKKKTPHRVSPWNRDWDVKAARQYWSRRICAFLAGALAETLRTRCWQQQPISDRATDEYNAWTIADFFDPPTKADRWVNRLRFQMLETLRAPNVWSAVEAVAVALMERKTLTSHAVKAILKTQDPTLQTQHLACSVRARGETRRTGRQ